MRNIGANLELVPSDEPDVWEIYWKKEHLGRTAPLPKAIKGEDLWILATGPSIKDLDLSKLQGHKVLGLNGAIATCQEVGISPSHYAITDRDFFEHRMPLVVDAVNSGAHCLFSMNGLARICEQAPQLLTTGKISLLQTVNRYYGLPQLSANDLVEALQHHPSLSISSDGDSKIGWSRDISHGVFTANTIAYIGCQIAESLGAENAYLLGMDLGSPTNTPARSYEDGQKARPTTLDKDYESTILPSFELLRDTEDALPLLELITRKPAARIGNAAEKFSRLAKVPIKPLKGICNEAFSEVTNLSCSHHSVRLRNLIEIDTCLS